MSRGACAEAASMLDAALKLLDKLPEGAEPLRAELALRSIEAMVAFVLYGAASQERERAIRRMCELGETIGEGGHLLRGLIALRSLYFSPGEPARGLELSRRWLRQMPACSRMHALSSDGWRAPAGSCERQFRTLRTLCATPGPSRLPKRG